MRTFETIQYEGGWWLGLWGIQQVNVQGLFLKETCIEETWSPLEDTSSGKEMVLCATYMQKDIEREVKDRIWNKYTGKT